MHLLQLQRVVSHVFNSASKAVHATLRSHLRSCPQLTGMSNPFEVSASCTTFCIFCAVSATLPSTQMSEYPVNPMVQAFKCNNLQSESKTAALNTPPKARPAARPAEVSFLSSSPRSTGPAVILLHEHLRYLEADL